MLGSDLIVRRGSPPDVVLSIINFSITVIINQNCFADAGWLNIMSSTVKASYVVRGSDAVFGCDGNYNDVIIDNAARLTSKTFWMAIFPSST